MAKSSKAATRTGTMDKKIKSLVLALNALGIATTGSCEGHIDGKRSPAPWVKILTADSIQEKARIKLKVKKLLLEFYKNHPVSSDVPITVMNANSGFWIHNGGRAYTSWRVQVNRTAKNIAAGLKVPKSKPLNRKTLQRRKEKLTLYQNEMSLFANFLKGKLDG